MVKFCLKVILYVAVVMALAILAANCFALDPKHILVGSATATYYDGSGSLQGRTKSENNKILIYGKGNEYAGRIESSKFYDHSGALVGRASESGSKISLYDRGGAYDGYISVGSMSRFYDKNNAYAGKAEVSGGSVRFYDANGKYVGRKQ